MAESGDQLKYQNPQDNKLMLSKQSRRESIPSPFPSACRISSLPTPFARLRTCAVDSNAKNDPCLCPDVGLLLAGGHSTISNYAAVKSDGNISFTIMISDFLYFLVLCNLSLVVLTAPIPPKAPKCPDYSRYAKELHSENSSLGRYNLPFQRPIEDCRTYYSQEVEASIERLKPKVRDPDLFRLFENAFPNTLDTAVRWKGFAYEEGTEDKYTDEDLAFVITGDMYVEQF